MEARWEDLDERDRSVAELTKRFVDAAVRPHVRAHRDEEWSAPPGERVPWGLIEEADRLGLRTLPLPERHGGRGLTAVSTLAAVAEELARGESSLVDILLQGWKVGSILLASAAPEVSDHWLGRFASEPRLLFSHCSTEPHGSSDRWLGYDAPESAMRTRAERRDGGWVLDGRKQFITNGPDSSLYVVYATTIPGAAPSRSTSSFLVPRGTEGFRVGEVHEKIGGRLFNNAELVFEDCRLPQESLLVADTAMGTSGRVFPGSKVVIAAQAVGVAQAALEEAADFVRTRVQGGRPIVQHQMVAGRISEMATRVEAARALVRRAARAIDRRSESRRALTFMAKVFAAETAFEVARQAVELHGGLGVMRHAGVERLLRDATLFLHLDGTNDIHRLRVVKELFPETAGSYAGP